MKAAKLQVTLESGNKKDYEDVDILVEDGVLTIGQQVEESSVISVVTRNVEFFAPGRWRDAIAEDVQQT